MLSEKTNHNILIDLLENYLEIIIKICLNMDININCLIAPIVTNMLLCLLIPRDFGFKSHLDRREEIFFIIIIK